MSFRKNAASQFVTFQLIDATSGAALLGAVVTVRRCIDGVFAAGTGTVTEDTVGNAGWYVYAASAADLNGNDVGVQFTAPNAIPVEKTLVTTASTALGYEAIDWAAVNSPTTDNATPTNITKVNAVTVKGVGTVASPWNPT